MDIKYTIEILTKDIQDIENLVGNLQNSPEGSTLELDLALSKLRNVYDVLTSIRTDISASRHPVHQAPPPSAPPSAPQATVPPPAPPVQEPAPPAPPAPEPAPPSAKAPAPEDAHVQQASDQQAGISKPEESTPPAEAVPQAAAKAPPPSEQESQILADTFSGESSINDNLAEQITQDGKSEVLGEPIDSISRNIGINDRFLIIRELFDGNADEFGRMMEQLDSAGSREAAKQLINTRFRGTLEHEGVQILDGLSKRRYSN